MKRKCVSLNEIEVDESNIDDSIYFYASLLEQLIELKQSFGDNSDDDEDDDDSEDDDSEDDVSDADSLIDA